MRWGKDQDKFKNNSDWSKNNPDEVGQKSRQIQNQLGLIKKQSRRSESRFRQIQKQPGLIKNNLDEVRQRSDKFRKNPDWSKDNPDEVHQRSDKFRKNLDWLKQPRWSVSRIGQVQKQLRVIKNNPAPITSTQTKARGLQDTYPQKETSKFFQRQNLDPPAPRSKKQEARGLHKICTH